MATVSEPTDNLWAIVWGRNGCMAPKPVRVTRRLDERGRVFRVTSGGDLVPYLREEVTGLRELLRRGGCRAVR